MKLMRFIVIFCLTIGFAKAQMVTNNKRAADVYFANKEYYAAAKYYQKTLQISSDSSSFIVPYGFENKLKENKGKNNEYEYGVFQLANSLRLYRNFKDAEKWYAIAINFSDPKYILSSFWYGECLRANLKYEEAISAFNQFIAKYNGSDDYISRAKTEIESCRFALEEMGAPRLFKLSRLTNDINKSGSNYSPLLNNQTFYFTSSRPVSTDGKIEVLQAKDTRETVTKKETPYVNTIYTSNADPKSTNLTVSKINLDLRKLESAAPALHPNGNVMFLTIWSNKVEQKRNIYWSKKLGNDWSEPLMLGAEVNVAGFNAIQPFVSTDGKYLIFSSDRPGGFGKYDLWYAPLRLDFSPGAALNLGPQINSKEDDQAPYYNHVNGELLFSSNGRVGLGGFDFYESKGNFKNWTTPQNLGYPFNSAKDDLYFTPVDQNSLTGYISSDRESLCCLEIFQVAQSFLHINGRLIDCQTLQPLEGATVTLTGKDLETQKIISDKNGNYSFKINSNRGFQLNVAKDNYFAKNLSYTYNQLSKLDTLLSNELCLTPFKVDKPIVLENVLYEFDKATLTDSSKLILNTLYQIMEDNPKIEIELSAHTDNIGSYDYNMNLSEQRAKSCVDYLVTRGISPTRMRSKGYGFAIPVAQNQIGGKDNPAGRALNRRTEFKVTKK